MLPFVRKNPFNRLAPATNVGIVGTPSRRARPRFVSNSTFSSLTCGNSGSSCFSDKPATWQRGQITE